MRLKSRRRGMNPTAETLCPQPEYVKFSWAAISMVASPLVKPAKKKQWSNLAKGEIKERWGKRWRQSECCRGENKREGVQADVPDLGVGWWGSLLQLSFSHRLGLWCLSAHVPFAWLSSLDFTNTIDNSSVECIATFLPKVSFCHRKYFWRS